MYTTLIEPLELAAHAAEADWLIVDCRFELANPAWGAGAYAAGHLPHALYAHLDDDLSGARESGTGRHPLPEREKLASTFSRFGIDSQVQVVAYDQGNGAFAARLWWLLRWMGHRNVAVLNGGFAAWQQAGLPIDRAAAVRAARRFVPQAALEAVVSTAELARAQAAGALTQGTSLLVDARGADRFAGMNETIDPVAGHVPGARNHPFATNVDPQGRFLDAAELRSRWQSTLGQHDAAGVISMCGSGVTACHNLLAMHVAGLEGARLYAGSWSEWIRDSRRPVAVTPTSG